MLRGLLVIVRLRPWAGARKVHQWVAPPPSTVTSNLPNLSRERLLEHGAQCDDCGIALQTSDPSRPGYITWKKKPAKDTRAPAAENRPLPLEVSAEDLVLLENRVQFELGEAFLEYANSNAVETHSTDGKPGPRVAPTATHLTRMTCVRCHDAHHQSRFEREPLPAREEVVKNIPTLSPIVHVVSAVDFPAGLNCELIRRGNPVMYVVNKIDLLIPFTQKLLQRAQAYFSRAIHQMTGSKRGEVFLVSATKPYGIRQVLDRLPQGAHLVGDVNAGKSAFVRALLHADTPKHLMGVRSKDVGPQPSNFAGFTRDSVRYQVLKDRVCVDMPGLLGAGALSAHLYLVPGVMSKMKQARMAVAQWRNTQSKTLRVLVGGGKCVLLGGVLYVVVPLPLVAIVTNNTWILHRKFKSIERARQVAGAATGTDASWLVVEPSTASRLQRYIVPPFRGTADVVVPGVGFVTLKPTSSPALEELFEVYAPEGVAVFVRESIVLFMVSLAGGSSKEVPDDRHIFSRLVPVPDDLQGTALAKHVEAWLKQHGRRPGASAWVGL